MDFYDEMCDAILHDAAKRGVRVNSDEWQKLLNESVAKTENRYQTVPENVVPVQLENTQVVIEPEVPVAPVAVQTQLPQDWASLRNIVMQCNNCPLCQSRANVVFGEGNEHARLMFIGEGPGAEEDASGRPFVGPAGQLLDKMIAAMHLAREEVYIANIVKCRPPGNRMPGEDEARACITYLETQIKLIAPEVIVLLGGTALHFLLQIDGITRYRGRWQSYNNIAVMPTFHPAFLLRKPEAKREAWHDLKQVMARLGIVP